MFSRLTKSASTNSASSPSNMAIAANAQANAPQSSTQIIKIVLTCRVCQMIHISDKKRILCPYCGNFYDSKLESNVTGRSNIKSAAAKNKLLTKNRQPYQTDPQLARFRQNSTSSISMSSRSDSAKGNSNKASSSDDEEDESGSEESSDDETKSKTSGGVRNFFKNLFSKKNSKSSANLSKKDESIQLKKNMPKTNEATNNSDSPNKDFTEVESNSPVIIESLNLLHPFLTVKNKDLSLFQEYRDTFVKTQEEFRCLYKTARETGNYAKITDFYCWIFSKSSNLIDFLVTEKPYANKTNEMKPNSNKKHDASFYVTTNWRLMKEIFNCLQKMPDSVTHLTIKSMCFCIVNDLKPMIDNLRVFILRYRKLYRSDSQTEDNLLENNSIPIDRQLIEVVHTLVIFLCCPLLDFPENNPLFSIILVEIASLSSHIQNSFIYAMRRMPLNFFRDVLRQIQNFLSNRLFPNPNSLFIPLSNDWVAASVKVMALLHCTNEMQIQYYQNHFNEYTNDAVQHFKLKKPQNDDESEDNYVRTVVSSSTTSSSLFISYEEFYIRRLDRLDLVKEYVRWEQIGQSDRGFSFCQYPFLLSIEGKRKILERDSEQQMIQIAKRSYLNHARSRNDMTPNALDLFLTIKVKRNNLVADSLNEIELKKVDLKKKLRVNFINEAGIDMGGVRKEWFLLLVREIFSPLYGMFTYIKESNVHWFTTSIAHGMLAEYNLIGVLMGLAVYNGEILDIHFPPCVYKKLASQPIVSPPGEKNTQEQTVGVLPSLSLFDLKYIMPDLASSLQNLLDYEGNVQQDFMMKFEVSFTEFDVVKSVPLKENGHNIDLTNENRKEYVDLYVDYLLNKSIYEQFKAFYEGFHSVCASNAMILFRPEEIELLVCGSPEPLNINDLRQITIYEGYIEKDDVIQWFWDIIKNEFDVNQKKRLLLFTTGSDRIPLGGVKDMSFKITRIESKNQLPMAHTCFNQLILPHYKARDELKSKLLIAIENAEGFGIK